MSITIASIRAAINDEIDRVVKSKSNRGIKTLNTVKDSFEKFTRKLRTKMEENNKESIRLLRGLYTKVSNASTKSSKLTAIAAGKILGYNIDYSNKERTIQRINDDIRLLNVINIHPITMELVDLPAPVSKFMVKYTKTQSNIKAPVKSKTILDIIKTNRANEIKLEIAEVDLIEPLPLFIMLGFLKDDDMFREKIQKELGLDENLLPQDYHMFENFNKVVVKDRGIQSGANKIIVKDSKTGKYNSVEIVQTEISKKFKRMEDSIQDNIKISDFSNIPKEILSKYNTRIHEINSIFKILRDFGGKTDKDYTDSLIGFFVNTFHQMLKDIKSKTGKKAFAQYIIRSLDLLEIRRQIYSKDLENMIVNGGIISEELAHSLPASDLVHIQEVDPDNVDPEDPEVSSQIEHYNERFNDNLGSDNQFFDDEELSAAFGQ
jgi:hypothetical protein